MQVNQWVKFWENSSGEKKLKTSEKNPAPKRLGCNNLPQHLPNHVVSLKKEDDIIGTQFVSTTTTDCDQ